MASSVSSSRRKRKRPEDNSSNEDGAQHDEADNAAQQRPGRISQTQQEQQQDQQQRQQQEVSSDVEEVDGISAAAATAEAATTATASSPSKKSSGQLSLNTATKSPGQDKDTNNMSINDSGGDVKDTDASDDNEQVVKLSNSSAEAAPVNPNGVGDDGGNDTADDANPSTAGHHASHVAEEQQHKSTASTEPPSSTTTSVVETSTTDDVEISDKERRIRELISHRTILQERVNFIRSAAHARLGSKSTAGGNTRGNASEAEDRTELSDFRETIRQANQSARRSSSRMGADGDTAGGSEPKRSSLSLRRGSNVGKKMNSALSSLAPHSIIAGSLALGVPETGMGNGAGSSDPKATKNVQSTASKNLIPGARLGSSNVIPTTTTSASITSRLPKSDNVSQQRPKSSNKRTSVVGDVTTAAPPSRTDLSIKTMDGDRSSFVMNTVGSHTDQSPLQPKLRRPMVIYPEAMALRDQRDKLQSDLRALLQTQQQQRRKQHDAKHEIDVVGHGPDVLELGDEMVHHPTSPTSITYMEINTKTGGGSNVKQPNTINDTTDQESVTEPEVQARAVLPSRRKTHWDVVLEEMSWLATDFREERKWKVSSAKMLALDLKSKPLASISSDPNDSPSRSKARSSPRKKLKDEIREVRRKHIDDESQEATETSDSDPMNNKNTYDEGARTSVSKEGTTSHPMASSDDKKVSIKTSSILSSIVLELDGAIRKGGLLEVDDRCHFEALERFEAARVTYLEQEIFPPKGRRRMIMLKNADQEDEGSNSSCDDPTMESISNHLERLAKLVKSRSKISAKDFANIFQTRKINLTSGEKLVLEQIDRLWGAKPPSSAILSGPAASGKTFVASAILWKYRERGPHLVVCPPKMVICWRQELCQLSNMRVVVFGLSGGISSPDFQSHLEKLESNDVVVCEYGLLSRLQRTSKSASIRFQSVAVDLRYPFALVKSMGISLREDDDSFSCISQEILTSSWWDSLIALLMAENARCLLIEYDAEEGFSLSRFGLSNKEEIEILAKRAACLIGPRVFGSSARSLVRNIFLWARKKGKNETDDKIIRVRKVLNEAISPFFCKLTSRIVEKDAIKWTIHSCQMPYLQKEEYSGVCTEIRGALSAQKDGTDSSCVPIISNALMKLRRLFFVPLDREYPCSDSLSGRRTNEAVFGGILGSLYLRSSPAQPDIERAKYLLSRSGKLRELLVILVDRCGFEISVEAQKDLEKLLRQTDAKVPRKTAKRKKVAILAELPEAQLLVSILLNCLGIRNALMLAQKMKLFGTKPIEGDSMADHSSRLAVLWGQSQGVLSRFSNVNYATDVMKATDIDIVVLSQIDLGGLSHGVGIESADVVISIDEDWSGRNRFITDSMMRRILAKNSLSEIDTELIKLVCADSLEFNIYKDIENNYQPEEVDVYGRIMPCACSQKRNKTSINDNHVLLPKSALQSILEMRGERVAKVLSTVEPPPTFLGSNTPTTFLTKDKNQVEESTAKGDDLGLLLEGCLIKLEQMSFHVQTNISLNLERIAPTCLSRAATVIRTSCAIMTRQDLFTAPVLMHLENPEFSSVDTAAPIRLSQLTESCVENTENKLSRTRRAVGPFAFLFYKNHSSAESDESDVLRRFNSYAEAYKDTQDRMLRRDGNQGKEPLVFFPPLFPLLSHPPQRITFVASNKTKSDLPAVAEASKNELVGPLKRKADVPLSFDGQASSNGKRSRIESDPSRSCQKADFGIQVKCTVSTQPQGEKLGAEGAMHPLLDDDFGLIGNGVMLNLVESGRFSAHDAKDFGGNFTAYRNNNDDFVSDQIPSDREELGSLARQPTVTALDSVLLFVRKRPRRGGLLPIESLQALSRPGDRTTSLTGPSVARIPCTDDSAKKGKKNAAQGPVQTIGTAFNRVSGTGPAAQNRTGLSFRDPRHRRGDFRHHLLQSYTKRHELSGLALVESISYKIGSLRVGSRIQDRLERLLWKSSVSSGSGPGIPIESTVRLDTGDSSSRFIKIVQAASSGGRSGFQSWHTDQSSLQNTLILSRRVDFGPFQAGFLASPDGVIQPANVLSRVGVSLPMGVKIKHANIGASVDRAWVANDSNLLEEAAKRFGSNWKLVARVLSGLEGIAFLRLEEGEEQMIDSVLKSSVQCRTTWQLMLGSRPSLTREIFDSEKLFRVIFNKDTQEGMKLDGTSAKIFQKDGICVLHSLSTTPRDDENQLSCDSADVDMLEEKQGTGGIDSEDINDESQEMDKDGDSKKVTKANHEGMHTDTTKSEENSCSSFAAVFAASKKKIQMPIQIPGIVPGEPLGPPAPSHPSHMHSVQSSITAQWAQGRTEMWPLQILDLADKQRAHAAQQRLDPTASSSSRRQHPSNGASSAHHPHHPQYNYHHQQHRSASSHAAPHQARVPGPSYVPVQKSSAPTSGDTPRPIERPTLQQIPTKSIPAASKPGQTSAQIATKVAAPAVGSAPAPAPTTSPKN